MKNITVRFYSFFLLLLSATPAAAQVPSPEREPEPDPAPAPAQTEPAPAPPVAAPAPPAATTAPNAPNAQKPEAQDPFAATAAVPAASAAPPATPSPSPPAPQATMDPARDTPSSAPESRQGEKDSSYSMIERPLTPAEGQVMLLAHMNASAGFGATAYSTASDDGQLLALTGSLLGAVMPGPGRFSIGSRLRGGAFVGRSDPVGMIGLDVLLGSTLGPRRSNNFGYFLAGPGVEYIPLSVSAGASAHVLVGWSFGGFSFGAGWDAGGGADFGFFNLGIHIGYGTLAFPNAGK